MAISNVFSISESFFQAIVAYLPTLASALAVLFGGLYLANWVTRLIGVAMKKRDLEVSLQSFIKSLVNVTLKVLLLVTVAGMLGIQTTSFVAVLGAAGLAVGLALQGSLSNFAGGVLILFFKPYKVGDTITAEGHSGKVSEIQIFNTILLTNENRTVILPNGQVSNHTIVNHTRKGSYRTSIDLYMNPNVDISKLRTLLIAVMDQKDEVLDDLGVKVEIGKIGAGYLLVHLRYFTEPHHTDDVKCKVMEEVIQTLNDNGIKLIDDFTGRTFSEPI
jgi:small conductance mechanosensitive channel